MTPQPYISPSQLRGLVRARNRRRAPRGQRAVGIALLTALITLATTVAAVLAMAL